MSSEADAMQPILPPILNNLYRQIQVSRPSAAALLQPGLSRDEISGIADSCFPFPLPAEIYQLYEWKNGTAEGPHQERPSQIFIFDKATLIPLERVAAIYYGTSQIDPSYYGDIWKNLIPVFEDDEELLYYAVRIKDGKPGPIFTMERFEVIEPEEVYPDLISMIHILSVLSGLIGFDREGKPIWTDFSQG